MGCNYLFLPLIPPGTNTLQMRLDFLEWQPLWMSIWMKYPVAIHRKFGLRKHHIQRQCQGCKATNEKDTTSLLCDSVNRFIWSTQLRENEAHNAIISSEICSPHEACNTARLLTSALNFLPHIYDRRPLLAVQVKVWGVFGWTLSMYVLPLL